MKYLAVIWLMLIGGCGIITWPDTVETGFEKYTRSADSLWISVNGQHYLSEGRIDSVALDGEFSLFSEFSNQVVFEYVHQNPEPDAKFLVTVWCKSDGRNNGGAVVAMLQENSSLKEIGRADLAAETIDGWEKRELLVQLPPNHQGNSIHFRLVNQSDDPVWFDQFKLEFLEKVYYPEFTYEESVHIRISEPDLERLREKRLEAFRVGYIDMDKDDWVRAEVEWKDTILRGNLTFKGDQLYNLEGDKWTFKLELDEGNIRGMRYFSLHDPKLRSFLDEWLFHEILKQEGIVCSDYSLVPLTLNGRSLGIYAMEERLLDELFVYQDTINAIGRFKDIGFVKAQTSEEMVAPDDVFDDAGIDIFCDDSFSEAQKKDFKRQLNLFRNCRADTDSFDKIKAARMLAVCDIMEAYSALHWTNIRLISDAATSKMEFAGNDGFTNSGPLPFRNNSFLAWAEKDTVSEEEQWKAMYLNLFNDEEFTALYLEELGRLSNDEYLNVIKLNTMNEMKHYQALLEEEWPEYRFEYSRVYSRARKIAGEIPAFEKRYLNTPVNYEFRPQ